MTITRKLAQGNICELDTVITRENRNDLRETRYSHQFKTPKIELSGKDVLERASEDGHYVYELDGKKVEGRVVELMYRDDSNFMPRLFLTFEEFVEQGKPLKFERHLVYNPVKGETN